MRTTVFLIIASIAWIAWLVSALAIEKHREGLQGATLYRADYPMCVTVHPPPITPPADGTNVYPRRKDNA